jgi:hypothetical protein
VVRYYLDKRVDAVEQSPCKGCDVGHGGYTYGKDGKGEYIEVETCQDTCMRYREYVLRLPKLHY